MTQWEEYPRKRWAIRRALFKLVRPFFVRQVDPNEDYECGHCGRPVLRRVLFCSLRCSDENTWHQVYAIRGESGVSETVARDR